MTPNFIEIRRRQRLEFALVLAREAGKLYQQSQMAIKPAFSDRLLADSDREFTRAMKIVDDEFGSGNQAAPSHSVATVPERSATEQNAPQRRERLNSERSADE